MRPYRIGSGAGYSGDRIDPAQDLAARGELDALVFECLAERTIALAQLRRAQDPAHGYDPLLKERMRAVLPACVKQGITVITNMGAAHPLAAGQAVLQVARELGLAAPARGRGHGRRRAALDARARRAPARFRTSRSAAWTAGSYRPTPISARTRCCPRCSRTPTSWSPGEWPIRRCSWRRSCTTLAGRPTTGSASGQGIVVGHLLECAAQVSGGYIADPGFFDVPGLHEVGFPLAEVQPDGRIVITKLAGTGGRIDRLTCTAQLLYELEDPSRYLQPDVVADFSGVHLREDGPDRVRVEGATGHRPARQPEGDARLSRRLDRRGADLLRGAGRPRARRVGAGRAGAPAAAGSDSMRWSIGSN